MSVLLFYIMRENVRENLEKMFCLLKDGKKGITEHSEHIQKYNIEHTISKNR